jgi:hypothetical protein
LRKYKKGTSFKEISPFYNYPKSPKRTLLQFSGNENLKPSDKAKDGPTEIKLRTKFNLDKKEVIPATVVSTEY